MNEERPHGRSRRKGASGGGFLGGGARLGADTRTSADTRPAEGAGVEVLGALAALPDSSNGVIRLVCNPEYVFLYLTPCDFGLMWGVIDQVAFFP